jgi:hypothetical protein
MGFGIRTKRCEGTGSSRMPDKKALMTRTGQWVRLISRFDNSLAIRKTHPISVA